MASAAASEELSCSICLNIYTNPVMLTCGHNFCQDCIVMSLDRQQESGVYTCPECRAEFPQRPSLLRNLKLCNIAGHYRSARPKQEETGIFCTYCVDSPLPAVKTCLLCEVSLCDSHLESHSKSEDHVLRDPTAALGDRKCSVHNEYFKYYCFNDSTFICETCNLGEKHRGHQVKMLEEASDYKKVQLSDFLNKVNFIKGLSEMQLHRLEGRRNGVQGKAMSIKDRVTALFGDIREHLADLENKVLDEVTRQEEQVLLPISDLIQKLEIEIRAWHEEILQIEKLCNITDPFTLLKDGPINPGKEFNMERDPAGDDNLDAVRIAVTLQKALYKLSDPIPVLKAKRGFHMQDASDLTLNVDTASNKIGLSRDLKNIFYCETENSRPPNPLRFTTPQVLSTRKFSSGQHYWEVKTSEVGYWSVGVAYNNIEREGETSYIGCNSESWCLNWVNYDKKLQAKHNNGVTDLNSLNPVHDIGIYLDYEGGRLSFYELTEPIRLLHTFSLTTRDSRNYCMVPARVTAPVHAAFCLGDDYSWIMIKS
ncbi:E3 ubiquitin-protein ligase TRIM11-like [Ascaphus truei]|uniref:E3 ubiquitin-protein ligase TRIM11-like n=1 Tax=Ascaphus truei TaxID=8439 RepID=UPI003F59820C